ncbi:MAG: head decoration protein [Magnetococcales bacterium]|nr:head decoration protein [Magnetococcales bacterium]
MTVSRDTVTIAAGQYLPSGTVVGFKTADGKARALDPTANDGTEIAAGVLIQAVDATAADALGVVVVRHAIVSGIALVWPDGITSSQKNTALTHLKVFGVVV